MARESTAVEKSQVKIMDEAVNKYFKHFEYFKIYSVIIPTPALENVFIDLNKNYIPS